MIANKARVYALRPDARSRLNTAYMTCSYLGGTVCSWLGVRAHTAFGWPAVCALIALLAGAALLRHPAPRRGTATGGERGRIGANGRPACMEDGRKVERMATTRSPQHRGER